VYNTRVYARIPNGHPRDNPHACPARGERSYSCGKLNGEVAGHADVSRAEVGEDVRVGVHVRVVECQLKGHVQHVDALHEIHAVVQMQRDVSECVIDV